MSMPSPSRDESPDSLRDRVSRVLRPYVDGTAKGMSAWVMTEARVAATAREAAKAVLPLLGTPLRSAHRVRRLIVPTLTCSWLELDAVYEDALTRLLALPEAVPGVVDPVWDTDVAEPAPSKPDWNSHGAQWTPSSLDAEIVVGPSGTVGRLVRSDGRQALIVEDGRSVRTRAHCTCSPPKRRERGEVSFELVTFGRGRSVLDVRVGLACTLCRAPVP